MKNFLRYLKHILLTVVAISVGAVIFLLLAGNKLKYDPNYHFSELLENEGPFVITRNDTVYVSYIHGNSEKGYWLEQRKVSDTTVGLSVYYGPDSSSFPIVLSPYHDIQSPPSTYETGESIFVVSDIEGNYKSFRDFLINNQVIDKKLNWTFGKGHLVLLGDFIDRGFFVNQVLYLIYRLEQDAERVGGKVHFILGNHEIMNMQGDHGYASGKYSMAASLLKLKPNQLYDPTVSFLARWLASKNTVERINNVLFAHGGLHPDFAGYRYSLDSLNNYIRRYYGEEYYPRRSASKFDDELLRSSEKSPYWYRGYFKGDIDVATIDSTLNVFEADKIVVGHTIQSHVDMLHDGRVIAVDVEHPQERWGASFPSMHSEGLLIMQGKYFRVLDTGLLEDLD
ncbi:metallophosphoesterase [Pseudochryseolinea flava]|uniref:Calcineurin-like phosphoesterase domain-containing protein n=1 Tax=Pseudochryseolinea flava TaxID=2059302 RepID=A0A364XUC2_9BACT|nr:metallophosphoesterase [Pseudochryseolinea flava]RAV97935.1 hypothetical protein DQQ10_26040 [Pseudochryseolinea flava]